MPSPVRLSEPPSRVLRVSVPQRQQVDTGGHSEEDNGSRVGLKITDEILAGKSGRAKVCKHELLRGLTVKAFFMPAACV